jgi:hypothetical protein
VARPLRGGRPRRPREERGQLLDLLRVGDHIGEEAELRAVGSEEVGVVLPGVLEGRDLFGGERELAGLLVVPVLAEHLPGRLGGLLRTGVGERALHVLGGVAQVLGGVVRPEIAAVAHHRAVLLQAAAQEDLLAGRDVVPGVDHLAVRAGHLLGQRHRVGVGPQGQHAHHEEPEDHHQGDALNPSLGEVQLRPVRGLDLHSI